jgi:DNA-binding transcriptional MerR regulator
LSPSEVLSPISAAVEATGLSERQIRYYESRGLLSPARSTGGHRRYSREDINRLKNIRQLRDAEVSVDEIRKQLEVKRTRRGTAGR